jgi:hypothetical protein
MQVLWSDHFSFYWTLDQDHFLLFAEYDRCVYMPLPPLGAPDRGVVDRCFDWMDRRNPTPEVSRIENVDEADLPFYQTCGFIIKPKAPEYLYRREALAELNGDRHKTQRWACNHFEKNYRPIDRPYTPSDRAASLALFHRWAEERATRYPEAEYKWMLQDSESAHRRALNEAEELGIVGRVVEVSGRLVGYTLGFPLNAETFCVFAEVTDLQCSGAAAYLFRAFSRTLTGFTWINTMDDSGLANLREAKERYHPERKAGSYLIRR